MKKKIISVMMVLVMVSVLLLPTTSMAAKYSVPITSYDAFRSATIGKSYDVDGSYGAQCWDGAALFWQQLGMSLVTGNGYARGCWELNKEKNAGTQFTLIFNLTDVKRGDVVVFGNGTAGHICFADEDYSGNGTLKIYGQNQGTDGSGGPFNVVTMKTTTFLGAFRYKAWACKHTYSNYVCTKCGAWDESSLKSKTTVDQYFASTNNGYVRSGPYNDCKVLETLAEGTVIHAVQKVTTAKGTIWYKLDDGRWIYESNVKTAAPVSFANIAGYTPKQEQIIGTTNATIVTTIKFLNNAAMKGCTKVGIYLYDSSGSTSSSHQLATGSDAKTWTVTPGAVWYDINKELNYTLKPNTTYYYRFYAVISGTTYYSDLRSFTTTGTCSHTFSGWATSLEPTHTDDGCKYRYCTKCGYTEYANISATGHTYNRQNTSSTYLKSAATCQQAAVYYYSCSCGAKGTSTFTSGSPLGHNYVVSAQTTTYTEYRCTRCQDTYRNTIGTGGGGPTGFNIFDIIKGIINSILEAIRNMFRF